MQARSSEVVRKAIEDEIDSGVLSVGDRIDESGLAKRFALSRTPVREAIMQLVAAGAIALVPRGGAVVTGPSPRRAIGMVETLIALEAEAAGLAARRMSLSQRETLEVIHREAEVSVTTLDSETYIEKNRVLHELIYSAAANEFLAEQIRFVRKAMRFYHRSSLFQPARLRASWFEHGEVVAAILAGDETLAQKKMREHILFGGRVFGDLVSALESSTDRTS